MKNGFVVVVLVAVGWSACMKRSSGTQGSEPSVGEAQALAASENKEQTDGGCAVDSCPDGGTGCLDIDITQSQSGNKKFDPPPRNGWTMCSGQELVLKSTLNETLCVDLRNNGTPVIQRSLGDLGQFTRSRMQAGSYCLTVCKPKKDRPCTEGCEKTDCTSQHALPDTIRGNLDVITKGPIEDEERK